MTYEAYVVSRTSTRPQVDSALPVMDAGCGPGHATAHLAAAGADARGLSPEMVAEARQRHPDIRFEVGNLRFFSCSERLAAHRRSGKRMRDASA